MQVPNSKTASVKGTQRNSKTKNKHKQQYTFNWSNQAYCSTCFYNHLSHWIIQLSQEYFPRENIPKAGEHGIQNNDDH